MTRLDTLIKHLNAVFLSEKTRKKAEFIIVITAIVSFVAHLTLIFLHNQGVLGTSISSSLLTNPISAIYTPFSFILLYEVFLLVYYLPQSISKYIGKQYEIITLILIRRIYYDLANLEFTESWFRVQSDLQFTYDIIGTIILFGLILLFYKINDRRSKDLALSEGVMSFIRIKKMIALILVPMLILLATWNLFDWVQGLAYETIEVDLSVKKLNTIFYDEFFTILIMTDVLLLLISFLHTDSFNTVIRNSGFVISTILIKLSFSTDGLLNTILMVVAVLFGVIILWLHNQYEKMGEATRKDEV
jgi:heme A synthase